jgi:uncharacterized delta-60 repeat protein
VNRALAQVVITPLGAGDDRGWATALQADGKILLVGDSHNGTDRDFGVVRYDTDFTLDSTFGVSGVVTTPIGLAGDTATDVVVQPDGKIVVVGVATMATNDFAVVRYNADGTLDPTFGTGGIVTTIVATPDRDGSAAGVALQPADGKIVVVGTVLKGGTNQEFAVVRYLTDGSLDTTFDADGLLTTKLTGGVDRAEAVVVQPDGKILVAGMADATVMGTDFAVVRYLTDGTLDTSFGGTGIVITDITGGADEGPVDSRPSRLGFRCGALQLRWESGYDVQRDWNVDDEPRPLAGRRTGHRTSVRRKDGRGWLRRPARHRRERGTVQHRREPRPFFRRRRNRGHGSGTEPRSSP